MDIPSIGLGLNIMGIGVAVVFCVLAVFYGMTKLLMKVFPAKDEGTK